MTNFYVTYSFSDENTRRKFYEEVKAEKIGEKTRVEDGCIRYADRDDRMFLWEQWESRDAQKKHLQQPHFATLSELKAKYVLDTEILVEDQYSK